MLSTSELEFIERTLMEAPALVTRNEAKLLYSLGRDANQGKGSIVEIGSYKGGTTILLARGLKAGSREDSVAKKVYAIDPQSGLQPEMTHWWGSERIPSSVFSIFKQNVVDAGIEDSVVPIKKSSFFASLGWRKPVQLLWIDGRHEYIFVKLDFLLWERHLLEGGVIAFHDTQDSETVIPYTNIKIHVGEGYGPGSVVNEFIKHSGRFSDIQTVDSITYARKTDYVAGGERYRYLLITLSTVLAVYYTLVAYSLDFHIGRMGLFLNDTSPRLYIFLKKIKSMFA